MNTPSRTLALDVLRRIEQEDAYSHIALDAHLERSTLKGADRALATELVYGTIMWQGALDNVLERFVKGGVARLDLDVLLILRCACYQWLFLDRIPDHAILNESVQLAKHIATNDRTPGFVNGVLRAMTRQDKAKVTWWQARDEAKKPVRYVAQRYALPSWIANRLVQRHGLERAKSLADSMTKRPGVMLRRTGDHALFSTQDSIDGVPNAYRFDHWSDAVRDAVSSQHAVVQDLGSQLVGLSVGVQPNWRVLDACAGLGGKSVHLASLMAGQGQLVCVEPQAQKLKRLESALADSDIALETHCGTFESVAPSLGAPFDAILLDAPCSGLGVIRRHPETKWRRKEHDIQSLRKTQHQLLQVAAPHVKVGGILSYSVCTFTAEEGPKQARRFLEEHPNFEPAPLPDTLDWSVFGATRHECALNPLEHDSDGFYMARFRKIGDNT